MHDIVKTFEKDLNFTTDYYKRFDGNWGSFDEETKIWSGMVNNTLVGDADMIVASLTVNAIRSTAIDYLPVLAEEFYGIAIKNPDAEDLSWVTFVVQFSTELWLAIMSMSLVVALVMWLTTDATSPTNESHVRNIAYNISDI